MRTTALLCLTACLAAFATGCMPGDYTVKTYYPDNFLLVKPSVVGESKGFSLFCFIPIISPTWTEALSDLHEKAQLQPGTRQIVAHESREESANYFILFSRTKRTVHADVIEVTDAPPESGESAVGMTVEVTGRYEIPDDEAALSDEDDIAPSADTGDNQQDVGSTEPTPDHPEHAGPAGGT